MQTITNFTAVMFDEIEEVNVEQSFTPLSGFLQKSKQDQNAYVVNEINNFWNKKWGTSLKLLNIKVEQFKA